MTAECFEDAPRSRGIIKSRHSRRSVPTSLSQSEFAFGLRTGVSMISKPMPATEASNPMEKIASGSAATAPYSIERRIPGDQDSLAERGEFELPVPISEQSDYNKISGSRRPDEVLGSPRRKRQFGYTVGNPRDLPFARDERHR